MDDKAFELLRDDLKEIKRDIKDLRLEIFLLKEDKAIKKGALYILTSIISVVASIGYHLITGYNKP